ncbi:MAG: hypothetical protein WA962_13365, partial [Ornithinimicrobium sp.]
VAALREAAAQRRGDIRAVIARSPDIVLALRPALVASPLVVPATVPESLRVDLVVLEHAHRTRTCAAVAALSHATQALIVGDHLRIGPQPFSYVVQEGPGTAPADPATEHGSSLLDDASAILPVRTLSTHYRAVDQRLVRPLAAVTSSPVESFPGVWGAPPTGLRVAADPLDPVPTATAAAVDLLLRGRTTSLVILTDRPDVAAAIQQALRVAAADNPLVRAALQEHRSTGLVCVPMARWAGDIRDHLIWVRGADPQVRDADVVTALAAARRSLTVIGATRGHGDVSQTGVRMLHELLAAPREPAHEAMEHDHPLMQDLVSRLRAEGFTVRSNVGTGPYAVPLAIEDPARPGRQLVAIDVDLAPRTTPVGRDDVRLRPDQLARGGWTPMRILATNLFRDPAREVSAVVSAVRQASLEKGREVP